MPVPARALKLVAVVILLILLTLTFALWRFHHNGNALWQIISQQCVPGQLQKNNPSPCERVDVAQGFVTLKDRNGPLQYLLMPIARISGIESPALLDNMTPDFLTLAWQQRSLLSIRYGAPLPDSAISLSVNSEFGRTQNQLHIHISCLRSDIRQQLNQLAPRLNERWQHYPLGDRDWLIRALTAAELKQQSGFMHLAYEVPQAQREMGKYGLALTTLPDGRLALMAIKRDWLRLNRASAEALQDHQCAILQPITEQRAAQGRP
jgi:CDP-diacylglycerol pyrophosphatase